MKRQVNVAKLHDLLVTIPGIGNLENQFPFKSKNLKYELVEGPIGLELTVQGVKGTVIIPYANVKLYTVDPEVAPVVEELDTKNAKKKT